MIINENSKVLDLEAGSEVNKKYIVPEKLDCDLLARNIIYYDNKYYFCKKIIGNKQNITNELLGSYLAKAIDLPTVDYQIGIKNNNDIYACSELFFQPNNRYLYPWELGFRYRRTIHDYLLHRIIYCNHNSLEQLDEKVLLKVLKLTVLDLKMDQVDRTYKKNTMMTSNSDGTKIDLCPVYDFGNSYHPTGDLTFSTQLYYANPFIILRKNKLTLNSLIKKYPMLLDIIKQINEVPINQALSDIEKQKDVSFTKEEWKLYEQKDKEITKLLTF